MTKNAAVLCIGLAVFMNSLNILAEFDHSSIDEGVFNFIVEHVQPGATILELGSGWATGEFAAKGFNMVSIEHDERWLEKYESHYIYAPILGKWYDPDAVAKGLVGIEYAAILVDGPPGYNDTMGRYDFLKYLKLFDTNVLIIIDDIERPQERALLYGLVQELGRSYKVIGKRKLAAVIFPR